MLLILSLFIVALGASLHEAEAASCHLREVDLCMATVLLGASDGVPGNDEDLEKVCEPVQEGIECIGNYSQTCFTPLMQEIFNMVIAEPKKYQNLMCTPGTDERAQYLKHAPCFQKALSTDNMKPYLEDFMAALEVAAESKFQKRVPTMCCGLQRMFKNTIDLVTNNCGQGVLEEGSMLIGLPITSISNIFCNGYQPDSPKCAGVLPPPGTPSKGSESKIQLIQFMNTAISNWQ